MHHPSTQQSLSAMITRQWSSLSDADRKILLGSDATTASSLMMDSANSSRSRFPRQGRGQPPKGCLNVAFSPCDSDTDTAPTMMESFGSSRDSFAPDVDIINHICKNYGLDLDTLHAHMAYYHTEANKKKHQHWLEATKGIRTPSICLMCIIWWQPSQRLTSMAPSTQSRRPTQWASLWTLLLIALPTQSAWHSLSTMSLHLSVHQNQDWWWTKEPMADDCCIIKETTWFVDIKGIDNHVMEKCPIVMARATVRSNCSPVIVIMNQYAMPEEATWFTHPRRWNTMDLTWKKSWEK